MTKQLLQKYENGNYTVFLYTDGTKEKITQEECFKAEFPDSIDLKISNYCDANCPMCHENSGTHGLHADLNASFLSSLPAGIELAIGGGNPLSHPDLIPFLKRIYLKCLKPSRIVLMCDFPERLSLLKGVGT